MPLELSVVCRKCRKTVVLASTEDLNQGLFVVPGQEATEYLCVACRPLLETFLTSPPPKPEEEEEL